MMNIYAHIETAQRNEKSPFQGFFLIELFSFNLRYTALLLTCKNKL